MHLLTIQLRKPPRMRNILGGKIIFELGGAEYMGFFKEIQSKKYLKTRPKGALKPYFEPGIAHMANSLREW